MAAAQKPAGRAPGAEGARRRRLAQRIRDQCDKARLPDRPTETPELREEVDAAQAERPAPLGFCRRRPLDGATFKMAGLGRAAGPWMEDTRRAARRAGLSVSRRFGQAMRLTRPAEQRLQLSCRAQYHNSCCRRATNGDSRHRQVSFRRGLTRCLIARRLRSRGAPGRELADSECIARRPTFMGDRRSAGTGGEH